MCGAAVVAAAVVCICSAICLSSFFLRDQQINSDMGSHSFSTALNLPATDEAMHILQVQPDRSPNPACLCWINYTNCA